MAISVTLADVTDAEDFLEQFLAAKIQDGDYTDGSALRDLTIKGIAYAFAYLKKLDEQIRARQSLKSIDEVDVSDDVEAADDAADEIISNWFASRNRGKFSRVNAYGHATERVDIDIPANAVFYKTASLPFILDNNSDSLHIAAEELIAQFDSEGIVTDYTFRVPLVSQTTGEDYNIAAGRFVTFDEFSAYVTYVETLEKAKGGDTIESTTDFIERSENLITVRNLINARSCDAVLRDKFPNIRSLSLVGMGDIEMIRDRVIEKATGLELRVGGHQDIFIDQEVTETSFSALVGAKFTRPDGVINVFRDPVAVTGTAPFTFPLMGVLSGMVLRIWSGLPAGAKDYNIREVRDTELFVTEKVPFPVATDEATPVGNVTWSVGNTQPDYDDTIAQTLTGETSRQIQNSGRITLPGGPLYALKEITINSPADPDADPADNLVHLNVRVNTTPTTQVAPDNEYQVLVHNLEDHQSERSFAELIVGPTGDVAKYDGYTCKVIYDTIAGFASIDAYVVNKRQRISAANPLVRAYHPIYVAFTLEYRLKASATSTIDEDEAVQDVLTYINTFSPTEVLDVSAISNFLRAAYPDIAHVYPFIISYFVHVPDGRVIEFESTEAAVVPINSSQLANLLVTSTGVDSLTDPVDYGLSDDVMRYLALETDILVVARSS